MSEKRFKYEYGLIWNENGEKFDVNECEGRRLVCDKLNEQQAEIERLNKELIKAITKSIPLKKYEDIDKKHKPWNYVNTNCD